MPKVTIRELTSAQVRFTLEGVDASLSNAVRRVCIAEVPTLAIDLVEVLENSSVLCDEFISHRLGLVPLTSTIAKEMRFPYEFEPDVDEDDSKTEVQFELSVKGVSESTQAVTSEDLVCHDKRVFPATHVMNEKHTGLNAGILLVKLRKNQEVQLQCTARKGIGKDHAKWSPVATAVFRYEPVISVNQEVLATLNAQEREEIAISCPGGLLHYDADSGLLEVDRNCQYSYDGEVQRKAQELGKPNLIRIEPRQDKFNFVIEGTGALPPEEIISQALGILQNKLELLKGELDLI